MKILIALGGNALLRKGQTGTVYEQFANTRESVKDIVKLIRLGNEVVVTHGNGPQVGNILRRVELAKGEAYYLPLGVCVAESQGEIGYMIAQTLRNKLHKEVACVLTQVLVDKNDPSMKRPTKPVGSFYDKEKVEQLKKDKVAKEKVVFKEDSGRGFRRVVPSPVPKSVVEGDIIRKLIDDKITVVACGGGGMPVYVDSKGNLEGVDGVVDKDLASAVLANEIGIDTLAILTAVDYVFENFGKEDQRPIKRMSVNAAKRLLESGQFGEGSMLPKIQASINFLENGGKKVIITSISNLCDALEGKIGTVIE